MLRKPSAVLLSFQLALQGLAPCLYAQESPKPAALPELRLELKSLEDPAGLLKQAQYRQKDHDAVVKALESLPGKLKTISASLPKEDGREAFFEKIGLAVASAAKEEGDFWTALTPDQRQGAAKVSEEAAVRVAEKLQAAAKLLETAAVKLEQAAAGGGAKPPEKAPDEEQRNQARLDAAGRSTKGAQSAIADGDLAFDNGTKKGDADGAVNAGEGGATGGLKPDGASAPKNGLVIKEIPAGVSRQPLGQPSGPSLQAARFDEAYQLALSRLPFVGDAAKANLAGAKRERALLEGAQADAAWLRAHGRDSAGLLGDMERALSLPSDERRKALLGLHKRLETVMDASATGKADAALAAKLSGLQAKGNQLSADLEKALAGETYYPRLKALMGKDPAALTGAEKAEMERLQDKVKLTAAYKRYEKDSDALKLEMLDAARGMEALQQEDADYFKARGLWGQYVDHNLRNLDSFKDGTKFSPEELGLRSSQVPSGVVTKSSHLGAAGFKYTDEKGLMHFQSPDGSVVLQEVRVGGKSAYVENRTVNGKLVAATYDENMKRLSKVVYTPVKDGLFESVDEDHPWPKTKGRFVRGQFAAESVINEDGSRMDAAGQDAPGVWVSKDKSGAVTGWMLSDGAFSGIKDPAERKQQIDKIASWVVTQKTHPGAYARYQAETVAALLGDQFRIARPGTRSQIIFDQEGKVIINKFNEAGGVSQVVAKWEDTGTGWGVGAGIPAKGLAVYVRQARSVDDPNAQFIKLYQDLGGWGRENFTTKTGDNLDSWTSWVTGPKTWETPVITREYRQVDSQGNVTWRKGEKVEKERVMTYEGKGIFGVTGDAIATLGKGTVDLAGSAVALGLAASPGYAEGVALLAGGTSKDVRDDLLARAKVNFFNNAISTQLGENYGGDSYRDGKKALNLDTSKYIQNVGQEMSDAGHPVLGAVLQGGVGFANNTVPLLLNIQGLNVVAKLGNAGKLTSVGVGLYMSAQGGYHFGSAVNEFGTSLADYNANDPASKARYYASIQNLTEQSLSLPMLFGGLKDVYAKRFGKAPAGEPGGMLSEIANAKLPVRDPELSLKAPGWMEALGSKVSAVDAKLPGLLQNGVVGKLGGKWLAGETGMPAVPELKAAPPAAPALEGPATPQMAKNHEAMQRALREQFEVGAQEFGKNANAPENFVNKLQKTEPLPELAPENAAPEVKAQAKTAREAAVAKMAQEYLGLKEPVKVIAPETDPLSGAQIYILKNAGGETVGVYKVFVNNGKGPLTVMNELGAGRELGAMNLKLSEPVKPLGAFRLGETGEIGYMMDGAPGKDFYGLFKGMGKMEPGSTARQGELPKIQNDVETMAKAMAEMHQASREGTVTLEAKTESVGKAMKSLDAMRDRLPPDVYVELRARFQKASRDFLAADVPGRITHGDAHPGNFFIKDGKVTMIDLETAMEAVGTKGEGVNSPVADAARFVEAVRLNNEAKGLKLTEPEMKAIESKFLDTYAKEMKLSPEAFQAQLDYYRARMQITALKYAKDPASFNQLLDAVKLDPALRAGRAEDLLVKDLTRSQKDAVQRAHEVGLDEAGKDGSKAGIGNYTQAQIRRKAEILKEAGFTPEQTRTLMEEGIVGEAKTPPTPMEWVDRIAKMPPDMAARVQTNPNIFKTFVGETLNGMKAQAGPSVQDTGSVAQISAAQNQYKGQLRAQALEAVKAAGLEPGKVITHGTTLKGLLGMLLAGEIRSTTRYAGSESSQIWGGYGVDVGAGYGATSGIRSAQPGVEIIMSNPTLKVVQGETLNRIPKVAEDFVAVIVTDGSKTIVLDRNALQSLAGSAKAWKDAAVSQAHSGNMKEFDRWEALEDKLVPK